MLREQVITPRAGRGTQGGGGRGRAGEIAQQRPVKRGGGGGRGGGASAWSMAAAWMPLAGKTLVVVCVALVCFMAYRTAASSSFFQLRTVDVSGVSQASEDQIKQIVRRGAAAGVWKADLAALSAEIGRQPWVRTAVVTRVLPSGLRVRISERVPRLVVRTAAGRFVWVDDDGVAVGPLTPAQQQPAFFMRGFDESGTDAARSENRRRVETFMKLEGEWVSAGLAPRVSELNLDDLRDVRAQLAGGDSQIEVRLGKEDWTKRLGQALGKLDEQRQTPRGALITYIDMTQGKRAVFGFNPHAQPPAAAVAGGDGTAGEPSGDAETLKASMTNADAARAKTEARAAKPGAKKPGAKKSDAKKSEKKEKPREGAQAAGRSRTGSERPRRVTKNG